MKNKIEFHPNPKQLWEEYHSVVAPVISLDGFDYERKYDDEVILHKINTMRKLSDDK